MAIYLSLGAYRLLLSLFEQVWEDDGQIVAVKPRSRLVPYSRRPVRNAMKPNRDSAVLRTGATGQESSKDTGLRFGVEAKAARYSCA